MDKKKSKPPEGRTLARLCARAAEEKKALDAVVLDMKGLSSVTDYFVICGCASDRQTRAVADAVEEAAEKKGARCYRREGRSESRWVVLDFIDVIVHIFRDEARRYYGIERLWGDAEKLMINDE